MRRAAAAALAVALAACAAPKPAPRSSACGREPAAVLACVRQREDAVTTLRARFNATSESGGESTTTSGVLLVAKPDRFRLRLMLPFGLTVFDAVESGGRLQMSLPLQGGATEGEAPRGPLPFSQIDLEEAFLRGPFAFPGRCEARGGSGDEILVRCAGDSAERARDLRLDAATATIVEEASLDPASGDPTPRFTVAYTDYRLAGTPGVALPYRIRLGYPARRISLDIEIEKYEVNPALAATLFRPIEP
jgi:hypothetical protein